ncbi:efflux RND transporter periplasmic adaptor subunit [Arachidicoccus terrestris]|uniref:efflux RND transporter periplasmic adaptor subunit n=1 Tax=Arachidicoccus terrestris TaxID=2875539 RepID=UPI001CC6F744|nr:efflux RND transporter periplasmic adaptor subunit [Arachidicoccus terrestris]UAY54884.1 efflux RND transporter periplasmic adaptor subunit [Arachidicoccus terrestris]
MSKKLKWIIAILVLLIVLLVILSKMGAFGKDEGIKVSAEKATTRTITELVTASGQIYPVTEVKVSSDISGEIVDLPVQEGDTVRKGQVLAKIYADIYASQRDQAAAVVAQSKAQVQNAIDQLAGLKASLNQTQEAYNRQKILLDQKVISQSEFEQAEQAYLSAKSNYKAAQATINANKFNVESSQASLLRAQTDVERATIVSPMDGIISLMDVKKGERVVGTAQMTGTEMMRIADLGQIEVRVNVGENDIHKVRIGDKASIQVDAYNQRKFRGVVTQIANPQPNDATTSTATASTTATNYLVHILLDPESYKDLIGKGKPFPFRPSMSASADIETNTKESVLAVPINAVTTRDTKDLQKADTTAKSRKTDSAKATANTASSTNAAGGSDDGISEVVFVIGKDGKVKPVVVQTGIQDINYIEITSGLKTGDQIVTGSYDTVSKLLKAGDKVHVVDKSQLIEIKK